MRTRLLMIAAATLALSNVALTETAQAFVTGSATTLQRSSQSLNMTQQVRRVCSFERVCGQSLTSCHWERVCRVTADYPPENGDRR